MQNQFKPAKESAICQTIKEGLRAAGVDVHPDVIREETMFRINGVCEEHSVKDLIVTAEAPADSVLSQIKGAKNVSLYKVSPPSDFSGNYILRLVYF